MGQMLRGRQQAYAAKSSTVVEPINVAKEYSAECSEEVLKNVALNVLRRVSVCVQQCG